MRYQEGKGIRLFKSEIKALLGFTNPDSETHCFVNFRVRSGKVFAWCTDGSAFVLAQGEAWDGAGSASTDAYEWQIHGSALLMVQGAMAEKHVATLRVSQYGTIRDIGITNDEDEEQLGTFNIPNDSIGAQLGLGTGVQFIHDAIRAYHDPAPTWAMNGRYLKKLENVCKANCAPSVRIYAPRDETTPVGFIVGDGAWQGVIAAFQDGDSVGENAKRAQQAFSDFCGQYGVDVIAKEIREYIEAEESKPKKKKKAAQTEIQDAVDRFNHATEGMDVSVTFGGVTTPLSEKARERVAAEQRDASLTEPAPAPESEPAPAEPEWQSAQDDSPAEAHVGGDETTGF